MHLILACSMHNVQAEVAHLKQRLSESRQASVRLEMKLATVKTENAKLLGSQQALNAIREQLSQENSRLTNREREMDGHWQQEREKLTNQLNSITAEAQQLKIQLAQQKEQLMVNRSCVVTCGHCHRTFRCGFMHLHALSLIIRKVIFICAVESGSVGGGECLAGVVC